MLPAKEMKSMKEIKLDVIKALPDSLNYTQKCRLLESLADDYRKKSRDEVNHSVNVFKSKR